MATSFQTAFRQAYAAICSGERPTKYRASWLTVGGAPALVDTESGSILAGCPGLEDEDIDEITDESDASRDRRERKQKQAEAAGYEPEETKDARHAWNDAHEDRPDIDALVLLKIGDTYYTFGQDAEILKAVSDVGDGDIADFKEGALKRYLSELVSTGHRVAIAERTEHGEARHTRTEEPEAVEEFPWEEEQHNRPRAEGSDRFTQAVVEAVGDDAEMVKGFKQLATDIWKRRRDEVEANNSVLRDFLGQWGVDGKRQGPFIRQVQRMHDADRIRHFDEMVEMAVREFPQLLEFDTGSFVAEGDAEQALFNRLQHGLQQAPARWSEEVISEALDLVRAAESASSRQPVAPELEHVPFVRPHSRRWWQLVRYAARQSGARGNPP